MITDKRLDEIYQECKCWHGLLHELSEKETYDLVCEVMNRRETARKICADMSSYHGPCINEFINEDEISAECEKICAEHDCKKCWEFFLNGHHGE